MSPHGHILAIDVITRLFAGRETNMLSQESVQPMLPVRDLAASARFYEKTLGLTPVDVQPGTAVTYRSGGTTLVVYQSNFGGTNQGTAALWEVDDVDATVKELKSKGVTFEHYDDLPGVTRKGDVYEAGALKVAWFKDPGGNILSVQNRPARQGQH
jgi:catechol 2,3-dioxygenase-like lactoylglutathione lyase family enzyme